MLVLLLLLLLTLPVTGWLLVDVDGFGVIDVVEDVVVVYAGVVVVVVAIVDFTCDHLVIG